MTPQAMVTLIGTELHDLALSSKIYDWINQAQEEMHSRTYWHHLEVSPPYQFNLVAPITTGTAAVVLGSTSVTITGGSPDQTWVGQLFSVSNVENWYYISAVVGQVLTLSAAYAGATNATATYSVDTISYTLPTDIDVPKIKNIVIQNPARKLQYIDARMKEELSPRMLAQRSQPWRYLDYGPNGIQVFPATDALYTCTVYYQKRPNEIDGAYITAGTAFSWPQQMHRCLYKGALTHGWHYKDDTQEANSREEFQALLAQHVAENNRKGDHYPRLRRFDESSSIDGRLELLLGRRILG